MMKNCFYSRSLLLGLAYATSMSLAQAGMEEAPVPTSSPAALADFSGEVSVGFDNRYIFRGLWFGDETAWANVSVSKEIAPSWTFSANVFYTDVMDNTLAYSEGNLGAAITNEGDYGSTTLGLTYYQFFDGFAGDNASGPAGQRDATEVYLTYSRDLFYGISGSVTGAYDFRIDAAYFEVGLSKSWAICDYASIDLSVATGYGVDDYYSETLSGDAADGFTHTLVSLAAPIQLAPTVTFTPHVSANFSHEARDSANSASIGDSEIFYGFGLAVSF